MPWLGGRRGFGRRGERVICFVSGRPYVDVREEVRCKCIIATEDTRLEVVEMEMRMGTNTPPRSKQTSNLI